MPIAVEPKPIIMRGDEGIFVNNLQTILTMLGYDPGPIDSMFGLQTEHAVKSFQADWGLIIDGIVNQQTWNALDNAMAGGTPPIGVVEWIKAHKLLTGALVGFGIWSIIAVYLVVKK